MAGIKTNADPILITDAGENPGHLRKRSADPSAAAGHVLNENSRTSAHRLQGLVDRGVQLLESRLDVGIGRVGSGMYNKVSSAQFLASKQVFFQGSIGSRIQLGI